MSPEPVTYVPEHLLPLSPVHTLITKEGFRNKTGFPVLGLLPRYYGEVRWGRGGATERERSCVSLGNAEDPDSQNMNFDKSDV